MDKLMYGSLSQFKIKRPVCSVSSVNSLSTFSNSDVELNHVLRTISDTSSIPSNLSFPVSRDLLLEEEKKVVELELSTFMKPPARNVRFPTPSAQIMLPRTSYHRFTPEDKDIPYRIRKIIDLLNEGEPLVENDIYNLSKGAIVADRKSWLANIYSKFLVCEDVQEEEDKEETVEEDVSPEGRGIEVKSVKALGAEPGALVTTRYSYHYEKPKTNVKGTEEKVRQLERKKSAPCMLDKKVKIEEEPAQIPPGYVKMGDQPLRELAKTAQGKMYMYKMETVLTPKGSPTTEVYGGRSRRYLVQGNKNLRSRLSFSDPDIPPDSPEATYINSAFQLQESKCCLKHNRPYKDNKPWPPPPGYFKKTKPAPQTPIPKEKKIRKKRTWRSRSEPIMGKSPDERPVGFRINKISQVRSCPLAIF